MADFLRTLLVLTVLGSALTGLLLVVRPLIKSKTVFYYLWLLVLLRLCLPVGITIPLPAQAMEEPARTEIQQPAPQPAQPEVQPAQPAQPQTPSGQQGGTAEIRPQPERPATGPAFDWRELLTSPGLWLTLWGVGAAFCLGRQVWGYRRFARLVRGTGEPPAPEAIALLARLDRQGRVSLTVSACVSTPMLLGILRPTIVLPQGVEHDRLEDILTHELTHARRHDLLYKWFAAAVTSLHWFNPLMLVVRRQLNRACELSCDEAVTRELDAAGRRHYGETLLAMAAGQSPRGLPAVTLCEEKKHLKERLTAVVKPVKKGPAAAALTLVLVLILTGCAAVFGAQPTPSAGPETDPNALLADPTLYDLANGLTAALPADLADDLLVETPEQGETFLSVYDRRSYEAGGGSGIEGMGWLFSIVRYDQISFEQSLGVDNSGRSFFARGDGWYYAYLFPTDVRFYSEEADQTEALKIWEELNRRLPEEVLPDFTARNGLEAFTSSDYFTADGTLWGGQHVYISYHTPDWSESVTMILSQPAKQGAEGIWCVEGYFNNQLGGSATVIPRDTGMTIVDYYAQLQEEADHGQHTDLLTPEGAALGWLSGRYDGVTAGQLTRLEGEPAWNLWYRELSAIIYEPLTVDTRVYADGQPTQVETVEPDPEDSITLWNRLWVTAANPDSLSGPAVVYDAGETGKVIFLEQDGLVGVEHEGETSWYRGAYDYEKSPYQIVAEFCQVWKGEEETKAADPVQAVEQIFQYDSDVELYGFKDMGSSPWIEFIGPAELPQLQEWLAACTWEEVEEYPLDDGSRPDPPAGCWEVWLIGEGQLQLSWDFPYVVYYPWGRVYKTQIWHCTQGYEELYAQLAGLWAEGQAADLPSYFRDRVGKLDPAQAIVSQFGDARVLAELAQVERAMESMDWTPGGSGQAQGEGIMVYGADAYGRFTFYPGNIVYYYIDDAWNFWYQGSGETDLYNMLVELWENASV